MAKKDQFYSEKEVLSWFHRLQNQPVEGSRNSQNANIASGKPVNGLENKKKERINSREKTPSLSKSHNNKSKKNSGFKQKNNMNSRNRTNPTDNQKGTGLVQGQTKRFYTTTEKKEKGGKKKQQTSSTRNNQNNQKIYSPHPTRQKSLRNLNILAYKKDTYVQEKTIGTFHRVLDCTQEIVTLHQDGNKKYSIPIIDALTKLRVVDNLHFGVQLKYWRKEKIRERINHRSIFISTEIIKRSGIELEAMAKLYPYLVPNILTLSEWEVWEGRVQAHLDGKPNSNEVSVTARNIIPIRKSIKQEPSDETHRKVMIRPGHFIVKVHNFFCINQGHELEMISARIFLRRSDPFGLYPLVLPAGYCKTCNMYYIHSDIYESNQLFRLPVTCEIIDEHDYRKNPNSYTNTWANLAPESLLKKCGYSVGIQNDPGDHARLQILLSIIDHDLMKKEEILSFLNWLIDKNQQQVKMQNALHSWRYDYKRLSTTAVNRIVDVGVIRH